MKLQWQMSIKKRHFKIRHSKTFGISAEFLFDRCSRLHIDRIPIVHCQGIFGASLAICGRAIPRRLMQPQGLRFRFEKLRLQEGRWVIFSDCPPSKKGTAWRVCCFAESPEDWVPFGVAGIKLVSCRNAERKARQV